MKIEQSKTIPTLDPSDIAYRIVQRSTTSRKGSALLIVIGTLALISVFAAVYISIGRTDRRAANAVRARNSQQDSSTNFAEYFSTIIGNDRLDAVMQYDGNGGESFGRREVTDAPYTDWTRRSESNSNDGRDLFTSIGGPFSMGGLNQTNDYSVASDPWLASTTPVFLGNPGFQNASRPFSTYDGYSTNHPNAKIFLDNRDWLQISNFAPDGRFVNLYNLRPNSVTGFGTPVDGNGITGRFNAESGTGFSEDPNDDDRRIRRLSNYLSLWDQDIPGDPESLIRAFNPDVDGVWLPGQNTPITLPGITDVFNTPAVWTMYQRFMFMPINQPFMTLNRNGEVSSWADPDFPAYQYADADGDGMADSRWIELTSARDKEQGDEPDSRNDIEVLYDRKDYRYFIAARAVDLSSLVNVNTATDLLVPPTSESPLGLTPADVDLRRLLTMQDAAGNYTTNGNFLPLSYAQLHRPYIGEVGVEPRFGPWIPSQADGWEERNLNRNVADYWLYKHEYERPSSGTYDLRQLENDSNSMLVGRYAYDALRQGIMLGSSLSGEYEGFDYSFQTPSARRHLLQYERDPSDITSIPGQISAEDRVKQYTAVGQLDPTNLSTSWSQGTAFGSSLYGMDDLVELLTFHGLNDPEITTRLERVTTGRYRSPSSSISRDMLQTQRLGPLMSNRPLSLDRQQHGLALIDIFRDPSIPASSEDSEKREVNGRIAFNSLAHFALTPRSKMTTISGSVGLVPSGLVEDPSKPEALTQLSAAPDLKTVISNPGQLFALYSSSLAGEIDTPDNFFANTTYWPADVNLFQNHLASTLFYGHRGPELALRIAAHAAVNMKDIADGDTIPTIATLVIDSTRVDDISTYLDSGDMDPEGDAEYQLYPGIASGRVFDPGESFLTSNNLPDKRQVVNVYGIEAMPVITEVSVLYAYTDASIQSGGDEDYNPGVEPLLIRGGGITYPDPTPISIDGEMVPGNADYLIQVLAFQLHNPYDKAISLGGAGDEGSALGNNAPLTRHRDENNDDLIDQSSNYMFDYYIEYAGRFYKVAKYLEWYPTINNFEGSELINHDDPTSELAFGTVNNPVTGINQATGGRMVETSDPSSYPDFISRNVILGPGESRVFYVIADRRFDGAGNPDEQWTEGLNAWEDLPNGFSALGPNDLDMDGLPDGSNGDPRGWTGPAEQWVEHQFRVMDGGTGLDPIMMMEFDPRDGILRNETTFVDPTTSATTPVLSDPSRNDTTEVRLWKKIVTLGEETTDSSVDGISSPTMRNLMMNDLLVDRMVLGTSLNIPFAIGVDLIDTVSYREGYPEPGTAAANRNVRNDNTGITVARWATNRRVDSPSLEKPSRGQVTPWMLRSRTNPTSTRTEHLSALPDELEGGVIFNGSDPGDPASDVVILGDFEIQQTLRAFFDLSGARGGNAIIQTVALAPHLKNDVTAGMFMDNDTANGSANKFQASILSVGNSANLDPISGDPVPEIFVDGNNIAIAPRLADLLLAWGIGPAYAPDPTRVANLPIYVAEEWMTGPESMAIALGVDKPNPTPADGDDADGIWKNAYDPVNDDLILDDGHFVIDNFVSYANLNLEFPLVPKFTPGVGGDIPRGTGVPMALGVIDHARAIAAIDQVTDATTPTPAQILEKALGSATFGQVNINTAPIEVLRLLPGLTPSRASYYKDPSTLVSEWWGKENEFRDLNLPELSNPPLDSGTVDDLADNPDVAAAIVAYRDRTYGIPTTSARPDPYLLNWYDNGPMNLEPTDPLLFANNMRGEFPLVTPLPSNSNVPIDRSAMTGIDGLRSAPGFGSLGELLAVQVDPEFEVIDSRRWENIRHLSIQQYGFDEEVSGLVDVNGENVTIMSQLFGGDDTGDTIDDYAEKLSMANSVLNTLSVRSDYYAVWFVVHGYQESDVANLRPEDPLIPTIKKRFLMVVDRTNVIEPGDKPKILVFKELPY